MEFQYVIGVSVYVAAHVVTFIYVRYVVLRNHYANQAKIAEKYEPFVRKDIENLNVFWCMPWYCTFWPRFFMGWFNALVCIVIILILSISVKDRTKISGVRLNLINSFIWYACFVGLLVTGH